MQDNLGDRQSAGDYKNREEVERRPPPRSFLSKPLHLQEAITTRSPEDHSRLKIDDNRSLLLFRVLTTHLNRRSDDPHPPGAPLLPAH